jgi:arylsulfatase A-like enzyme
MRHWSRRSFVAMSAASAAILRGQPPRRPNILLILADDLGYSDLGCYGGEIATPNLDGLAARGVRFGQFYTTARCCPSRASLLTGQYSHRVGVGHMVADLGQPGYRGRLSENGATIAEVLRPAGYRTFLSGKWHVGTNDPTARGFEEYFGTLTSAQSFWDPAQYLRLPAGRKARTYAPGTFYGTDALTDHALDFLTQARNTPADPWFLYLAYNAPHFPLQARSEDIAKYAKRYAAGWDVLRAERLGRMKKLGLVAAGTKLTPRSQYWGYRENEPRANPAWDDLPEERRADLARRMAIYAAMVDRMDQNVGRVLGDLRSHRELENTLILFLSDNGACAEWDPSGFDGSSSPKNILHRGDDLDKMGGPETYHSAGSGWANASNTPWRLYKHYTNEGGISDPCIVHWPDGIGRRGVLENTPAHLIDIMPTIVEATGARYPERIGSREIFPMVGNSLLPSLRGQKMPERTLYFEHEGHRAVRENRYKSTALRGQPWSLYDMQTDRTELNDLAAKQPKRVDAMARKWDAWAAANQVTPMPRSYRVDYLPER